MKTKMQSLTAWTCLMLLAMSCTDMGVEPESGSFDMHNFPSQIGDHWTYAVSDNVQKKSTAASVTVSGKMAGMPPVWLWQIDNGDLVETQYCQVLGDTVKMHYWDDDAFTTITYVFPLQAGKQWQGSPQGHNCTVVKVGPTQVPAGSFQSCFQIMERWETDAGHFEVCSWLVPDVGVIRLSLRRTRYSHLFKDVTWELSSYRVNHEG